MGHVYGIGALGLTTSGPRLEAALPTASPSPAPAPMPAPAPIPVPMPTSPIPAPAPTAPVRAMRRAAGNIRVARRARRHPRARVSIIAPFQNRWRENFAVAQAAASAHSALRDVQLQAQFARDAQLQSMIESGRIRGEVLQAQFAAATRRVELITYTMGGLFAIYLLTRKKG